METKTETKEDLIQRLLLEHEKKQEEERLQQEAENCLKKRKRDQYIKMFDTLGISHEDVIVIRNLDFKNTIVHAYDRVFDFKYLGNCSSDYYRKENDFCYIEKSSRSLEERLLYSGKPKYNIVDINIMNQSKVHYVMGDRNVHIFYENSATLCPFCGDLHPNENKDAVGYIFSDTYLANLRTQAVFYKRCYKHKNISRKDYLNSWNKAGEKRDSEELMELEESIYPTPIKHDKEYFKKKKEKTKINSKKRVKKKVNYNSNQYTEVGNVYLMKNELNGRIKIGRTKGEPVYRERTLQSQEPEVNLIFHREVLRMNETERYLHKMFESKRFRGEWFELSEGDIEKAKSIIKERKAAK